MKNFHLRAAAVLAAVFVAAVAAPSTSAKAGDEIIGLPLKKWRAFLIGFENQGSTHGQYEDKQRTRDRCRFPGESCADFGDERSHDQAGRRRRTDGG